MNAFRNQLKTVSDTILLDEARMFANELVKKNPTDDGENPIADMIRELCDRVERK